ncbi:YopX family protein [Bacillus thuringiensis]|uniref:YopX family protein n=1 Tax=Bacillus thuringiensis TaxID=1428 RepID=UPI0021B3311C|nr:YopX family protein [Bacillus thuringiensis]
MQMIKMNYFDKESNRMISWNELCSNEDFEIRAYEDGLFLFDMSRKDECGYEYEMNGVFHLCSGKKDMHNQEIYDGHVMNVKGYSVPFVATFQDGSFMLEAKDNILSMALNLYQSNEIEIVGDMYQFFDE